MASFFKDFLEEDGKRLNPATNRGVFLAVFGKHPGWKDYIDPIGLNTTSLLLAWDRLYQNGIGSKEGGPITSENSWEHWEEKTPGELLPGFGHVFVWWRAGQFLAGRMWATSDHARPPRMDYPFIACFQAAGVPLAWALRNLLPRLEEGPAFCRIRSAAEIEATTKQVWNSDAYREELRGQVRAGFERLQRELRAAAVGQTPPESLGRSQRQRSASSSWRRPNWGPSRRDCCAICTRWRAGFQRIWPKRACPKAIPPCCDQLNPRSGGGSFGGGGDAALDRIPQSAAGPGHTDAAHCPAERDLG